MEPVKHFNCSEPDYTHSQLLRDVEQTFLALCEPDCDGPKAVFDHPRRIAVLGDTPPAKTAAHGLTVMTYTLPWYPEALYGGLEALLDLLSHPVSVRGIHQLTLERVPATYPSDTVDTVKEGWQLRVELQQYYTLRSFLNALYRPRYASLRHLKNWHDTQHSLSTAEGAPT